MPGEAANCPIIGGDVMLLVTKGRAINSFALWICTFLLIAASQSTTSSGVGPVGPPLAGASVELSSVQKEGVLFVTVSPILTDSIERRQVRAVSVSWARLGNSFASACNVDVVGTDSTAPFGCGVNGKVFTIVPDGKWGDVKVEADIQVRDWGEFIGLPVK
jgi:hypothetical protein